MARGRALSTAERAALPFSNHLLKACTERERLPARLAPGPLRRAFAHGALPSCVGFRDRGRAFPVAALHLCGSFGETGERVADAARARHLVAPRGPARALAAAVPVHLFGLVVEKHLLRGVGDINPVFEK